jgi:hypothetical protein
MELVVQNDQNWKVYVDRWWLGVFKPGCFGNIPAIFTDYSISIIGGFLFRAWV